MEIGDWGLTMATAFEDLKVLKAVEETADTIWKQVGQWDEFARDVVGKQLARAADSIGANIAEAFGRFNFGEKLQFLYYARGSLFETKYWLNRAQSRHLLPAAEVQGYASRLAEVARQLNAFVNNLKAQRSAERISPKTLRESSVEYLIDISSDAPDSLFDAADIQWLQS